MARQHERTRRVYEAARAAGLVSDQPLTELATLLEETPQRIKNWDTRGPSSEGLLLIQRKTGINATWVESGEGPMLIGGSGEPAVRTVSFDHLIESLAGALQALPAERRERIGPQLSALALAPDSTALRRTLSGALDLNAAAPEQDDATASEPTWRQQAMRLAEAASDGRTKAVISDFLGKLDVVMRNDAPARPGARRVASKG